MILIVTHKTDFTADFVINKLNQNSIKYYRLNCEDILDNQDISISTSTSFYSKIAENLKFSSVWFRRTKYPELESINDVSVKEYCLNELDSFFENLWMSINADKWLSKPEHIYKAENKILQLRLADRIGFITPNTLVSTSKEEIVQFFKDNNNDVVIKPLFNNRLVRNKSQELIFTSKVTIDDLNSYDEYLNLPSIYQAHIGKKLELRVTVVGDKLFAASVDSQSNDNTKIDWRKEKIQFKPFEIPDEIAKKCILLTKKLNLSFGAIDLILDKNDNYTFLEINPNGQWAWIETDTGLPISESIINFLHTPVIS